MRPLPFIVLLPLVLAAGESPVPLAPGAVVERLGDGFRFTEGATVLPDGSVLFTDIPASRILHWQPQGPIAVWREDSGGANGLFVRDGVLFACEGDRRRVTRTDPDGTVTVLAEGCGGKRFNSPNDLWVDARGGLYVTDPRYGDRSGMEQDGEHVYYIAPDGQVTPVATDLVRPNGIVGTTDGGTLYVADHGAGVVWSYRIASDGSLADKRRFADVASDGMCLDERGNVYLTSDAVHVHAADGRRLGTIAVPVLPTNVCFGEADRRRLFISGGNALHAVRMGVRGVE